MIGAVDLILHFLLELAATDALAFWGYQRDD
jgi:hypothetical protein